MNHSSDSDSDSLFESEEIPQKLSTTENNKKNQTMYVQLITCHFNPINSLFFFWKSFDLVLKPSTSF